MVRKLNAYTLKDKTSFGPFPHRDPPAPVYNQGNLGPSLSSVTDRIPPPRTRDFSEQQSDPKAFPNTVSGQTGYDPYANGGTDILGYTTNAFEAAEMAGPQAMLEAGYYPFFSDALRDRNP